MYSTANSIFHISIGINCNRISEGLLYIKVDKMQFGLFDWYPVVPYNEKPYYSGYQGIQT
jgi:hypothetical protein